MSEGERIPETPTFASAQEPSERLPAVLPPGAAQGLSGFELPVALREAGDTGLRGMAWSLAIRWVEQQATTMNALRDDLGLERARNVALTSERDDAVRENAVLTERLKTRWVSYATGGRRSHSDRRCVEHRE